MVVAAGGGGSRWWWQQVVELAGNKIMKVQGDNTIIGNLVYVRTPSFWTLINKKNPKEYDQKDYERHKERLYETNVLYRDYDPRSNRSTKCKKIIHPIWEDFQHEGIAPSNYEADEEDEYFSTSVGLCRMYLQKNGDCFNTCRRVGEGIHITPRPLLAGMR